MRPVDTRTRAAETLLGPGALIRFCKTILHGAGTPRLHTVTAVPADIEVYAGVNIPGDQGSAALTYDEAYAGAIGECLERYSYTVNDPDRLIFATAAELGESAVTIDQFRLYTADQYATPGFPLVPQRPDMRIGWVEARSLISDRRRYVPAQMVYVPYRGGAVESPLCVGVSTGQACHFDRERAILTGLFEVIERDAFTITWMRRLPLDRIDYRRDPELDAIYRQHFDGCDLEFHVFDMTLDLAVPTVLCVAEGRGDRGAVCAVGAATRGDERQAIKKALIEAAQVMVWCRDLLERRRDWRPAPDFSNLQSFEDHVRLFCEPEMRQELRFLLDRDGGRAPATAAPPADLLPHCLREIERAGLDCLLVDATTADVAAAGFFTPKLFVPGLAAINGIRRVECMSGSPRLYEVPARLGFADLAPALNPIPHPFP